MGKRMSVVFCYTRRLARFLIGQRYSLYFAPPAIPTWRSSTRWCSSPGWRRAKLCDLGRHAGEARKLVRAQDERVSKELQLSGMKMPPLSDHDGCSLNAELRSAPAGGVRPTGNLFVPCKGTR